MSAVQDSRNRVDRRRHYRPGVRRYHLHQVVPRRQDRPDLVFRQGQRDVNIPVWAGVGAIVAGGVLLFVRSKD